jgi:hypothetical protein
MAQRILAENAGVETVRYTLPNKHYIAADMKYIGVDNTTPYVASLLSLGNRTVLRQSGLFHLWKCDSPRVVERKMMGERRGWFFFRSMPCPFVLCHPWLVTC